MKHPVELYPDFFQLSDCLEKIEKLVRRYDLDIDDAPAVDTKGTKLSHKRKNLFIKHSLSKVKKNS